MKKLNLILLSVFTLMLSGVLMACSFKKVEAKFTETEVAVSAGGSIVLDDYLQVTGVDKLGVKYQISNTSLFTVTDRVATPVGNAYGKTNVMAVHDKSSLASMQLVIKKPFDAPANFRADKDGNLLWDAVVEYFDGETTPTAAEEYIVSGTFTSYADSGLGQADEVKEINQRVTGTTFKPTEEGVYNLKVKAAAKGYFDDGAETEAVTVYYGYMPNLAQSDFSFANGKLSWSAVEGAKYQVKFDGAVLGEQQTETEIDLNDRLSRAESGRHTASVLVYDAADKLLAKESDEVSIIKLQPPVVNYNFDQQSGGRLAISPITYAQSYNLKLKNEDTEKTFTFTSLTNNLLTELPALDAGLWDATIYVDAVSNGAFYYKSDEISIGKIYKLEKISTFEGLGNNEANSSTFNVRAGIETDCAVQTKFAVSGAATAIYSGFDTTNKKTKDFEIAASGTGVQEFSITQLPSLQNNKINGEDVFVINSDASETKTFEKLEAFVGGISHSYVEGASVLTFQPVANAKTYTLRHFNGSTWDNISTEFQSADNGMLKFTLDGAIENIYQAQESLHKFEIEAFAENPLTSISSKTSQAFKELGVPQKAENDIDGWTYKWQGESNAQYRLEIYTFNEYKEEYEKPGFQPEESVKKEVVTVSSPEYTFSKEGFYFVKVFAVATQPTDVSSRGSLNKFFSLSRQLEHGSVYFGFDASLKTQRQTDGYFVKIEGDDKDTVSYEITVNNGLSQGQPQTIAKREDGIYAIDNAFASGTFTVKVVGHGKDEKVHTPTTEKIITVQRLAAVKHDDLVFDSRTNSVTLNAKTGVRKIEARIDSGDITPQDKGGSVYVDITDKNSFNLQFTLLGTEILGNNLFTAAQTIYLDSTPAKFNFTRMTAPENLEYKNGELKFTHSQITNADYYCVEMACTAGGDRYTLLIEVQKTENKATVRTSVTGGDTTEEEVTGDEAFYNPNMTNITIKIADILQKLENAQLRNILDVTENIEFSVWAYENNATVAEDGVTNVSLSSLNSDGLNVGKIAPIEISFKNTADSYSLTWTKPEGVATDKLAETKYVIYRAWTDASGRAHTEVIPSEEFSEGGQDYNAQGVTFASSDYAPSITYTFYVEVTNPYYLSSAMSNRINVYRLSPVESVTLTEEATLKLKIVTADDNSTYNHGIKVTFAEEQGSTTESTIHNGTITLDGKTGTYKISVVGAGEVPSLNENETTYYLDSAEVSYKLLTMSKLAQETEKNVTYASNLISWGEFGANIGGLEYVVFFQGADAEGSYKTYKTTNTQINLNDIKDLREIISGLSAGDVQVQVAAHIKPHKIEGDTIYYEKGTQALLSGETENNYYVYGTTQTIKKLSIPEIKEFTFAYVGDANRQNPNIEIKITGNYGNSAVFQVVLNDNTLLTKQMVSYQEEAYKLTIPYQDFANLIGTAQALKIQIYVLCEGGENEAALPSQEKTLTVLRASELTGVEFERNIINEQTAEEPEENRGFSRNLKLSFNAQTARPKEFAGGIVLEIKYKKNNTEAEETQYVVADTDSVDGTITYSLKEFIEQNLADGGTITISAFANNFVDGETYVLACPNSVSSETYTVLQQVKTGSDITRTEYGFKISSDLNNDNTIYIVEYNSHTYQVVGENTEEGTVFEFTIPEDGYWNEDTSYTLNIYAVQPYKDGDRTKYIMSKANEYSYSLSRLAAVDKVSLERAKDDNSLSLVWNRVDEAKEYLFRVYRQDKQIAKPYEYRVKNSESGDVKIELNTIFGRNYSLLVQNGIVSEEELKTDVPLEMEIISVPSGEKNYSLSKHIKALIYGNTIDEKTDFNVSKGLLYLTTKSQNQYRYRFISHYNEAQITDWRTVTSSNGIMNLLDTTTDAFGEKFKENCPNGNFALEAQILAGDVTSLEHDFGFDSVVFHTKETDLSFLKTNDLTKVGYSEENLQNIQFTFNSSVIEQDEITILVGLETDSLKKSEANEITLTNGKIDGDSKVFEYSFLGLTAVLGREVSGQLYFWAWQASADENVLSVCSQSYDQFSFSVITDFAVESIVKLGEKTNSETVKQDYINTYATFVDDDEDGTKETLGINVRVVQHAENAEYDIVKFIDKEKLKSIDFFAEDKVDKKLFAINLLEIFDSEELAALQGKADVSFSKIAVVNGVYSISNWVSSWEKEEGDAVPLTFTRLAKLRNIQLQEGDIVWSRGGNNVETYYVYLYNVPKEGDETSTFSMHETEGDVPRYEATKFTTSGSYYVAIQSINKKDAFVLSSPQTYKTTNIDGSGSKMEIHRNQVKSKLTLKDGALQVDWVQDEQDEDNFITMLSPKGGSYNAPSLAAKVTSHVFTSPFTFTVSDLISTRENEQVRFCLRFESVSEPKVVKTYYVNALYLLASLEEFSHSKDITPLETLGQLSSVGGTGGELLANLKSELENARFGIGNQKAFFDSVFETLQSGKYSLSYCLVGNYHTLNSDWYSFSANDVNEINVNEEPDVQILRKPKDNIKTNISNSYKVVVQKSKIVAQGGNFEDAKQYFVQVGAKRYRIVENQWRVQAGEAKYVLTTFDENPDKFVSVYECDSNGDTQQDSTHLMFYLTLNTENSAKLDDCFVGVFGEDFSEETSSEQPFEICAQGNGYSCSSKSELWRVTFLGFTQFRVVDGVFEWETQRTRDTTVVWKKHSNNTDEILPEEIDGSKRLSTFAMDDNRFGDGLYDYLKFIILGEILPQNVAYIDSEIVQVNNVYKLANPTLSNKLGELGILAGEQNEKILKDTYSKDNPYTYLLSNDATTETWRKADERSVADKGKVEFGYELGTTWVDLGSAEETYKQSETLAKTFTVQILGSTADFKVEEGEQYNVKLMKCLDDSTGEITTKQYITASSKQSTISGGTLDAVNKDNLLLEDGLLKWDAVTGRTVDGQLIEVPKEAKIIYRVVVERYITSYTVDGEQYPHIGSDPYDTYYTANTYFDFSDMKKNDADSQQGVKYRATVQALALYLHDTQSEGDITLVEGGYAGGDVSFVADGHVFMGNGASKDGITRLESVNQDIGITDGKLSWTFTPSDASAPAENFKEKYGFIVKDDDKNVIEGDFTVSLENGTYTIIFTEQPGAMKEGTYNISVTTTKGTANADDVVNSFTVTSSQEITKLAKIVLGDYTFEPNYDVQRETLSFEEYFKIEGNEQNKITATFTLQDEQKQVVFTSSASKFYILQAEQAAIQATNGDNYVHTTKDDQNIRDYIVIGDNASASVTFVVSREGGSTLASDTSENFVLQRSGWEGGQSITWNSQAGEFTWNFNKNSLKSATTANKMKLRYTVQDNTTLYTDQNLEETAETTIEKGTEVTVQEIIQVEGNGSYAKILYQASDGDGDGIYYIRYSSLKAEFVKEMEGENPVTKALGMTDLFEIVDEQTDKIIILLQNEYFEIETKLLQKPEFVVKATYNEKTADGNSATPTVRIYTTTDRVFRPTIIGRVSITIRIKLNNISLESEELDSEQVDFGLFESGEGTQNDQYIIKTAEQFKNIIYRMSKDEYLNKYTQQADSAEGYVSGTETDKYYFKIADDSEEIDLHDIEGILFEGTFNGELDGNNQTLKYVSSKTEELARTGGDITIASKDTAVKLSTQITTLTYTQGSALFGAIGNNGVIKDLNLSIKFGKEGSGEFVKISNHALISGLAITNSGTVQNVNLTSFENKFYGDTGAGGDSRTAMAYSGVVSINSGNAKITGCSVKTSIEIDDNNSAQLIFVGGIVYTNYASVTSCTAGKQREESEPEPNVDKIQVTFKKSFGAMQLSGIAVTNGSEATLSDCTNNMDIVIVVPDENSLQCYVAGIACLGQNMSNQQTNKNNGEFQYDASKLTNVHKTDAGIYAVISAGN